MGRPILPNSPLDEVVIELRFSGDLSLFSAWAAIQADLRKRYPQLLVPLAVPGAAPLLQPLQLVANDRREQVFLSINSFAFSTRMYGGFDAFKAEFQSVYTVFQAHAGPKELTRLGLRYVNRLPRQFPATTSVPAGTLHPCLKLGLSGWTGLPEASSEPAELAFQSRRAPLELRLVLHQVQGHESSVTLDFDCFEGGPVPATRVASFLEDAHQVIGDAFLAVVTDEYKHYLEGSA